VMGIGGGFWLLSSANRHLHPQTDRDQLVDSCDPRPRRRQATRNRQ
jgi:hypothetical protein